MTALTDITSFLTWAIVLTMIAALALGGLIGWVRLRERAVEYPHEQVRGDE